MDLGTFGVRRHLSVAGSSFKATESLTETRGKEKTEETLKSWRRSWISRRLPGQEGEAGKENGAQGPQNLLGPSSSRANQTYVTFHQLLFSLLNHTSVEGQDTSPKMAKLGATPEEMDIFASSCSGFSPYSHWSLSQVGHILCLTKPCSGATNVPKSSLAVFTSLWDTHNQTMASRIYLVFPVDHSWPLGTDLK